MIRAASSSIRSLLGALENTAGTISGDLKGKILSLLAECWDELKGADESAMRAFKLDRAEDLSWDPPVLSFKIERHGGTVLGSSRAELQRWCVNLHEATASCEEQGYRQLRPNAPGSTEPLVERVCEAVGLGPASECEFVRFGYP